MIPIVKESDVKVIAIQSLVDRGITFSSETLKNNNVVVREGRVIKDIPIPPKGGSSVKPPPRTTY